MLCSVPPLPICKQAWLQVFRADASDEGYYDEYPVREGAEECTFFVKSGFCKRVPFHFTTDVFDVYGLRSWS